MIRSRILEGWKKKSLLNCILYTVYYTYVNSCRNNNNNENKTSAMSLNVDNWKIDFYSLFRISWNNFFNGLCKYKWEKYVIS